MNVSLKNNHNLTAIDLCSNEDIVNLLKKAKEIAVFSLLSNKMAITCVIEIE